MRFELTYGCKRRAEGLLPIAVLNLQTKRDYEFLGSSLHRGACWLRGHDTHDRGHG
jgi:hypothetical protein